jgi:hypothetical protein
VVRIVERSLTWRAALIGVLVALGLVAPVSAASGPPLPSLVPPSERIPGQWQAFSEQSLNDGTVWLTLYDRPATDDPGATLAYVVTSYVSGDAAAATIEAKAVEERRGGSVVTPFENLGDGPAYAFEYPVLNADLRQRYRFAPDALASTAWLRIDHYMVTVQFGALADPAELQNQVREFSDFEAAWIREMLNAAQDGAHADSQPDVTSAG